VIPKSVCLCHLLLLLFRLRQSHFRRSKRELFCLNEQEHTKPTAKSANWKRMVSGSCPQSRRHQ
jgi:hypothetical protein